MLKKFSNIKRLNIHNIISIKPINLFLILMLIIPILNLGVLIITDNSLADIEVYPDTFTGSVTWSDSVYIIKGDLVIAANDTLNIPKGTTIKFEGKFTIFVDGKLYINGTTHKPVSFKAMDPNPTPGLWNGIRINSTGKGNIQFAVISHAINGIYLNQSENFSITSTIVKQCSMAGVVCNSTNNITLVNNSFSENKRQGLKLISSNHTAIRYNTINANQDGLFLINSTNNTITKNSISNRVLNTYDDDAVGDNVWNLNYYGDYGGVDNDTIIGDYIGDNMNYGINGPGVNNDMNPKTKIFNNENIKTYANLTLAVKESTATMEIYVPAITPDAGSQTLNQTGYYYENIKINSHDVTIIGPMGANNEGYKNTHCRIYHY